MAGEWPTSLPSRDQATHSATSFDVVRVPALVSRALLHLGGVEQATVLVGVGTAGVRSALQIDTHALAGGLGVVVAHDDTSVHLRVTSS